MGPPPVRTRVASTTVRVGRKAAPSSAELWSIRWCMLLRRPTTAPIQFFIPSVTRDREWCLTIGTLMTRSASTSGFSTCHSPSSVPPRSSGTVPALPWWRTAAPAARAAGPMPERAKVRSGSLQELSDHHHRRRARGQAQPDQLRHQLGVGVGGLLRGPVPGAVGLDRHLLAAAHEVLDAAERRQGTAEVLSWPTAPRDRDPPPLARVHPPVGWQRGPVRGGGSMPPLTTLQQGARARQHDAGQGRRPPVADQLPPPDRPVVPRLLPSLAHLTLPSPGYSTPSQSQSQSRSRPERTSRGHFGQRAPDGASGSGSGSA